MSGGDLRRLSPAAVRDALDAERSTDPTVVGVLLAAGTSSRFGVANKLLAEVDGEPLVRRAARTLRNARLSNLIAVLGCDAAAVRDALAGADVAGDNADSTNFRSVTNPDYERGLSTSVRAGVDAAAEAGANAVVFLPGDMPGVDPVTVNLLVDAYRADLADALAASYDGRRGNPVLFDERHFPALRAVRGDVGGKPVLLDADRGAVVETDDRGVRTDIDTRDDLDGRG
ncbi:nucleotidyltransferase family protein [Halococcus hamelinensis]|uniref:Molybdopterin-guanine dinucleotide biosynthesis protein A n=2 Tax=Halococcus hamelinensis TaxID=332168 RepID=M0M0P9_9EURY|nr:nucleotidyltransferase family protein [Halococcus hamelinensis]EMA38194.1 molybdopterin-guanine dinucleotide biosynthesis protein A [Halococcus hamelinensis 100A6]